MTVDDSRHTGIVIRMATESDWPEAFRVLYAGHDDESSAEYTAEMLAAHQTGTLSLRDMLVAVDESPESPTIVGCGLMTFSPGRVAMVWPPRVTSETVAPHLEQRLLDAMCRRVDESDTAYAQVLIAPGHSYDTLLRSCGFQQPIQLQFLSRSLDGDFDAGTSSLGAKAVTWEEASNPDRFAVLLEQSELGSADSPEVSGLRTGAESLAGHRAGTGFRADLSRIYRFNDEDAGVILMAEHPEFASIELLYLGVSQAFRGHGLGRRMLADMLTQVRQTTVGDSPVASMFLAVDQRNTYALNIYRALGFEPIERQEVWLYVPKRL